MGEILVELQILFHIQFLHIITPLVRRYDLQRHCGLAVLKISNKLAQIRGLEQENTEVLSDDEIVLKRHHPWLNLYNKISSLFIIYILARNLVPIEDIIEHSSNVVCFIPGRLMLYGPLLKSLETTFCFHHLVWRFLRRYVDGTYCLDMIGFMLQSEQTLNNFFSRCQWYQSGTAQTKAELHLREVMCYPVYHGVQPQYMLRPNRTKEAKVDLQRQINLNIRSFFIIFVVGFVIVVPMISYSILDDIIYVKMFPNCTPHLDHLYKTNQLVGFSASFGLHKFIMMAVDVFENFVMYVDSIFAVLLTFSMVYLLNHDLLIYWNHVHTRLQRLLSKLQTCDAREDPFNRERKGSSPSASGSTKEDVADISDIRDLQWMAADFFESIKNTDCFVSNVNNSSFFVWFLSFAIMTYYKGGPDNGAYSYSSTRSTYVAFITLVSARSSIMLNLYKKTQSTYPIICSLMARDNSICKTKYMHLLDYYTNQNRATYTFFRHYPFTPSLFLTIIGWTYSVSVIVEQLFEPSSRRRLEH